MALDKPNPTFQLPKHWRKAFDGNYLGEWNLYDDAKGRHIVVSLKIEKVTGEEVTGDGGRKSRCVVLRFVGKRIPMIVTASNGRILAAQFRELDPNKWVGREFKLGTELKKVKNKIGGGTSMAHVLRVVAPSANSEELKEMLADTAPPEVDTFDPVDDVPNDRMPGED